MESILDKIIFDIASENPTASMDVIAEAVIHTIESEDFVSNTIRKVVTPNKLDVRISELRSKRLPTKQRIRITERVTDTRLVERVKEMCVLPIEHSSFNPLIHTDGAKVYFASSDNYPDSPALASTTISAPLSSPHRVILESIPLPDNNTTTSIPLRGITDRNTELNSVTPADLLNDIDGKFDQSEPLSLYDFYQMISLVKISRHVMRLLPVISKILSRDLELRKKLYGSDSFEEPSDLYNKPSTEPTELRFFLPSYICESFMTLIIHEYGRLHEEVGRSFIDREISYESYLRQTERYALDADRLVSEFR
ncbi:MAG TPA: hypothetical protein VGA85_02080 [Dehalococcoidales bacterium]